VSERTAARSIFALRRGGWAPADAPQRRSVMEPTGIEPATSWLQIVGRRKSFQRARRDFGRGVAAVVGWQLGIAAAGLDAAKIEPLVAHCDPSGVAEGALGTLMLSIAEVHPDQLQGIRASRRPLLHTAASQLRLTLPAAVATGLVLERALSSQSRRWFDADFIGNASVGSTSPTGHSNSPGMSSSPARWSSSSALARTLISSTWFSRRRVAEPTSASCAESSAADSPAASCACAAE
jgi:hypothetical protein